MGVRAAWVVAAVLWSSTSWSQAAEQPGPTKAPWTVKSVDILDAQADGATHLSPQARLAVVVGGERCADDITTVKAAWSARSFFLDGPLTGTVEMGLAKTEGRDKKARCTFLSRETLDEVLHAALGEDQEKSILDAGSDLTGTLRVRVDQVEVYVGEARSEVAWTGGQEHRVHLAPPQVVEPSPPPATEEGNPPTPPRQEPDPSPSNLDNFKSHCVSAAFVRYAKVAGGYRHAIHRLDTLQNFSPAAVLSEACTVESGHVGFSLLVPDASKATGQDERDVGEAYFGDNRVGVASRNAAELLQMAYPDRFKAVMEDPENVTDTFDLVVRAYYCTSPYDRSAVVKCGEEVLDDKQENPKSPIEHEEQTRIALILALDHEPVTLSLISQPGRFMALVAPCASVPQSSVIGSDRSAPGCTEVDRSAAWLPSVAGSLIGVKVFWAPITRYPWVGWSASLSAASLGISTLTTDTARDTSDAANGPNFLFAPVDIGASLIDFRIPKPARFDITLQGGVALTQQGDGYRFLPYLGVAISTPLIDVVGRRYGQKQKLVTDLRERDIELELLREKVEALDGSLSDLATAAAASEEAKDPDKQGKLDELAEAQAQAVTAEAAARKVIEATKADRTDDAAKKWFRTFDALVGGHADALDAAKADVSKRKEAADKAADEASAKALETPRELLEGAVKALNDATSGLGATPPTKQAEEVSTARAALVEVLAAAKEASSKAGKATGTLTVTARKQLDDTIKAADKALEAATKALDAAKPAADAPAPAATKAK